MVAQDMASVRLTPPTRTVVIGSPAYFVSHLESVVRPCIERGEARKVLDEYSVATPGRFYYFPASAQVLPKLRAFIEYARNNIDESAKHSMVRGATSARKPRLKWDATTRRPQPLS